MSCGAANQSDARYCTSCGVLLDQANRRSVSHLAFLVNRLRDWEAAGEIEPSLAARLRERSSAELEELRPVPAAAPPSPSTGLDTVSTPGQQIAIPREPGPALGERIAEQAPNLLLYMGAFLVVMAGLIIISLLALLPLTVGFLVAGWYFRRHPRVALAANTYLAVGALLTPLNFLTAYILWADAGRPEWLLDFLWLAGSAYSALFYGAFALLGLGRPYAWLAGAALVSTWTAGVFLLDVPVEWAPPLFVVLAIALSGLPRIEARRQRLPVFSDTAVVFAHVVAIAAIFFSVFVHMLEDHSVVSHWALPVTLTLGAAFYEMPAWRSLWARLGSATLAGGVVLGIAHAVGVTTPEAFGVTFAGLGLAYPAARALPGLRRWPGRPFLWPLGLTAATSSWLAFLEAYTASPSYGASALAMATIAYLVAAWRGQWREESAEALRKLDIGTSTPPSQSAADGAAATDRRGSGARGTEVVLLYAALGTLSLGYFYLLESIPALALPDPSETTGPLALAYFLLSLLLGLGALPLRWLRRGWEVHVAVAAALMSVFVLTAGAEDAARLAGYAAAYALVAIALARADGRPVLGYAALPYVLVALVSGLSALDPPDPVWALAPAALGAAVYGIGWTATHRATDAAPSWGEVARLSGLALSIAAPLIAIGRLAFLYGLDWLALRYLGDGPGPVDPVQTPLHDAATVAMAALGLLLLAEARLRRSFGVYLGAAAVFWLALLMAIIRSQPDNIQFVSLPTGLYTWAVVVAWGRLGRASLTESQRELLSSLAGAAAIVILTPTLLQALGPSGRPYRFLLLGQGLPVFLAGVFLHQRVMVASAAVFIGLAALLQVIDVARALPSWAVLATSGILLLLGGTFLLLKKETWLQWRTAVAAWWRA
jgi:hypothetical protein